MTLGEEVRATRVVRGEEKEKSGKGKRKEEKEKKEKEDGKEKRREKEKGADGKPRLETSSKSKLKGSGLLVSSIGSDGVINLWDTDTRTSLLRFRAIFGHEITNSPLVYYALSVRAGERDLNVWGGGERSAFVWSSSVEEKQADGAICREIVKNAKGSQVEMMRRGDVYEILSII